MTVNVQKCTWMKHTRGRSKFNLLLLLFLYLYLKVAASSKMDIVFIFSERFPHIDGLWVQLIMSMDISVIVQINTNNHVGAQNHVGS